MAELAFFQRTNEIPGRTMIDRKNKMVSFRLSAEEYDMYRRACGAAGVRSLSELARVAIERVVGEGNGKVPVDDQLRDLRETVQCLSKEVRRLAQKMEEENAPELERVLESIV
jgi:hypothetical protein